MAMTEGVVRLPSAFSMTLGFLPSMTATHEFVVPRSIQIILDIGSLSLHFVRRCGGLLKRSAAHDRPRCQGLGRLLRFRPQSPTNCGDLRRLRPIWETPPRLQAPNARQARFKRQGLSDA